ncbi:hypothetical protein NQZ68_007585 [Dissostichus eleginoides]|nr:hypothetical protein NQZ68_007585 [Dissostichus eleginoides]
MGSIGSCKRSSAGTRSSVSTTSSCIKAEADMAALIARQKLLKDKHASDEQEEELRKKKEQLRKKREQLEMEVCTENMKQNMDICNIKPQEAQRPIYIKVQHNHIHSYSTKAITQQHWHQAAVLRIL